MYTPETAPLAIAVAFNRFEPLPGRTDESESERSVTLEAEDIISAFDGSVHRVFPVILGKSLPDFIKRLHRNRTDVVINVCEGYRGRPQWEGGIAALLDMSGLPFTGNTEQALVVCQDKFMCKAVLHAHGLPVPDCWLAASQDDAIPENLIFPVIVKPNHEDASLGITSDSVVNDSHSLKSRVRHIIQKYGQPALAEHYIAGREFNAAVIEDENGPAVLAVQEIDYSAMPPGLPHICGYEAKWHEHHPLYKAAAPVCPAHLDPDTEKRITDISLKAFRALGCRDYARVDVRMDAKGGLYILEVNPNPDVCKNAGFARALGVSNIDYTDFWISLVMRAYQRRHRL